MDKPYTTDETSNTLIPLVKDWFFGKFQSFSPPQTFSIMNIHSRQNTLISSPTGSGKTLSAFMAILNELIRLSAKDLLEQRVYCIYISPLKALANDIEKNLNEPLKEIKALAETRIKGISDKINIKISIRTGDTTSKEKSLMLKKPPHIIITTPESFAIMLTSQKFCEKLKDVDWVIIDEIHSIAGSKRGTQLSVCLERLEYFVKKDNPYKTFTRIGLSATVHPLEKVAAFLVGMQDYNLEKYRDCKIIDIQDIKKMDLKVLSPVPNLIESEYEHTNDEMYKLLDRLIQDHKTTLIFTNTRSATERVVHHLKDRFPNNYVKLNEGEDIKKAKDITDIEDFKEIESKSYIGAHHSSLSKEHRLNIENRLKEGKLKAVVSSTSLELGLDIGYIDLVILLGSPKSVSRALQRCLTYNSRILLADGTYKPIGEIVENKLNIKILSFDKNTGFKINSIKKYHKYTNNKILKIKLHSGNEIECTLEHPIMSRHGWKKAKDLKINDEVAEIFKCKKIYNQPYIIDMIDKHKYYIENRNNFLRKKVDSFVKQKNISYTQFANKLGINENHLQNYLRTHGRKKSIRLDLFLKIMHICKIQKKEYISYLKEIKSKANHRLPLDLKLDKDFMWLAGLVASDGSIVEHKTKKYVKIKLGNNDLDLLKNCQKIFNRYGYFSKIQARKNSRLYYLDCGSRILTDLLLSIGLKKGKEKSINIEISNILNKFPKELFIPYIEGLMEGDGNVHNNIRIFSASKKFVIGIHNKLNSFGIHNYFVEEKAKSSKLIKKINHKYIYCLYIGRKIYVKEFLKYCTFKGRKARELRDKNYKKNLKELDIDKNISWTKIKSVKLRNSHSIVYNLTLRKAPNTYFVESLLTHNCGRSGHALHDVSKGRIIVQDRDDLVECSVLLKAAIEKKIDTVDIPENCLDVLAQEIFGMSIEEQRHIDVIFDLIRKSYPYRNLTKTNFIEVIRYLNGQYASLEDRNVYAKIWFDEDTGMIGKRGRLARVLYMTNVGTIPDESYVKVKLQSSHNLLDDDKGSYIGRIDENFLERLKRGDVFVLGGNTYEFLYSQGMTAFVKASINRPPTVPSWTSEMLPLSFDLALEIQKFRRYMKEHMDNKESKEQIMEFIHKYLYVDEYGANAIFEYFYEQYNFSEIPNDKSIVIEHFSDDAHKYILFHTLYGRRVNDVLSRVLGFVISRIQHKDVEININDNGFYILTEDNILASKAFKLIKSSDMRKVAELSLDKTEVLGRRFRHCAMRALMILRTYMGHRKTVSRQQLSSRLLINSVRRISEDFPILKEAKREILEDLMDIKNAEIIISQIESGRIKILEIDTEMPSPFAFNLVTMGYSDIMKMEDKLTFIRRMHSMVKAKISLKQGRSGIKTSSANEPEFTYDTFWSEQEQLQKQEKDQRLEKLKSLAWNMHEVAFPIREHIVEIIDGSKNIRPDFIAALIQYKKEIDKNWPKELREFIYDRLIQLGELSREVS